MRSDIDMISCQVSSVNRPFLPPPFLKSLSFSLYEREKLNPQKGSSPRRGALAPLKNLPPPLLKEGDLGGGFKNTGGWGR